MNILFYTPYRVSERQGGTERITARISSALRCRGHKCYSAYSNPIASTLPLCDFDGEVQSDLGDLTEYIVAHTICVVIIQTMNRGVSVLRRSLILNGCSCRIFSVLHFSPGYEEIEISLSGIMRRLMAEKGMANRIKNMVRICTYPMYKLAYPNRNKQLYQCVYQYSDCVVLLSTAFIEEYANYCGLDETAKFVVIPNALSYDDFYPVERLSEKKKQVLVVSRLVDPHKRVYLAIQAWAEIEKDPLLNGWEFKIVGTGPAEGSYKEMAKKLGLKRVEFCGRQEPRRYYEESSVFLMTSSYEGWGLTLTEAQQFGCVPIAFDTYSSLHDIVNDGENGFIVEDGNMSLFVRQMKRLMQSSVLRVDLAKNAIESAHRFERHRVIKAWEGLLNS